MSSNVININLKKTEPVTNVDNPEVLNKLKIVQANGYKEIKEYENLANEFVRKVSSLAAFKKIFNDVMGEQVKFFLVKEILESLVKPIFEGNRPPFISEQDYLAMREDMYKDLINKYISNQEDNPF
jgi:hypothetical protein|nr:MAG TPA: hypothetical protein [Caudoviricetes sp.]